MMDITKIDKNFVVPVTVDRENLCYYDIEQEPFQIYGVRKENGKFRRMPEAIAASVSEGVYNLHTNTAGGRVRFVTDSPFVAVHAEIDGIARFGHMTVTGVAGLDMYSCEDGIEKAVGSFIPRYGMEGGFEYIIDFSERKERVLTVNFPLYSNLNKLYIGIEQGAGLKEAPAYTYAVPVVSYGSSITQGGCAARPGNCYQHILTRLLDCDHLNLGFSGCAMAEDEMIDWVKQLNMSVFIYDYDHNAPNLKHLETTHEKMFQAVRKAQPTLPIIIMPRPKYYLSSDEKARAQIVRATYDNAVAAGDKNVAYIDGPTMMAECRDNGLVDRNHPTDLGFFSMAKAIAPVLGEFLKKQKEEAGKRET